MEDDYEDEDKRNGFQTAMELSYSNLNDGKRKSAKRSYCAARKLMAPFQMAENLNLKITWRKIFFKVAEMENTCQNLN